MLLIIKVSGNLIGGISHIFILYPLATLLVDSVFDPSKGFTLDVFGRVLSMQRFQTAFGNKRKGAVVDKAGFKLMEWA